MKKLFIPVIICMMAVASITAESAGKPVKKYSSKTRSKKHRRYKNYKKKKPVSQESFSIGIDGGLIPTLSSDLIGASYAYGGALQCTYMFSNIIGLTASSGCFKWETSSSFYLLNFPVRGGLKIFAGTGDIRPYFILTGGFDLFAKRRDGTFQDGLLFFPAAAGGLGVMVKLTNKICLYAQGSLDILFDTVDMAYAIPVRAGIQYTLR